MTYQQASARHRTLISVRVLFVLQLTGATAWMGGCGERGDSSGSASDRGAPHRPEGASAQPTATRVAIQQDLRIDGHEDDLVRIHWLGVSRHGTIALLQPIDRGIRFFDADGKPLGTFGRSGRGPGEFQRPISAGWIGDTLWVVDLALRRITFISPERTFLRSVSYGAIRPAPTDRGKFPTHPPSSLLHRAVYADGTFLVLVFQEPAPLFRVSREGFIQRLVARSPPEDPESTISYTFNNGRGRGEGPVPFASRPQMEVSSDGSHIATVGTALGDGETGTYQVTLVDAQGDTLFSREYPFRAARIPESAVDSALERIQATEVLKMTGSVREFLAEASDRMPEYYAPVVDLFVAEDGRVWLGLQPTAEGRPWLILDAEGDAVGIVVVPHNVFLRTADQSWIWGVERDEYDVESVVRYRIQPGLPG